MADFSDIREDGIIPATFDHVAIVDGDRVEQPGTLLRDPTTYPQHIQRERRQATQPFSDRASDKFAVRSFLITDLAVHQLLPPDPSRKIARIQALAVGAAGGIGFVIGDETNLSAFAGNQAATLILSLANALGVFVVPVSATPIPIQYTSKQPLYYAALTTADPQKTAIQCFVETFDSGTPVT